MLILRCTLTAVLEATTLRVTGSGIFMMVLLRVFRSGSNKQAKPLYQAKEEVLFIWGHRKLPKHFTQQVVF